MKKYFLHFFVITVLSVSTLFAQGQPTLPFDFENGTLNYTFTDFGGGLATRVANPVPGGINTTGFVGKMIKNAGDPWGGSWISMAGNIDFSVNKIFKVKVYMPRVGARLLLKVENATNGGIAFEMQDTGTVANAWEELTFDFSAINTTNTYAKMVFIFDLGTVGAGGADYTYYFDEIRLVQGGGGPTLTQMNLPVTWDDPTINYGVVGFEGAEQSSIIVDPNNASNKVVKVIKSATAQPWAGTTVTAVTGGQQTGFSAKVPFTANEKRMNVRVYSPHAPIQVRLKVENFQNGAVSCETEATLAIANSWQTLVFDFGNPAPGTATLDLNAYLNKASIFFNFGVNGATAGEKTYYFDDVRFGLDFVPVELTSFTANANGSSVDLNWATASETNNKGFEIQRSVNNIDFATVAFIEGKGTSTSTSNYTYSDAVQPGKYTYRLKQIDYNGSFEYSNAIEVDLAPSSFSLDQNYPNPFNPSTVIRFTLPVSGFVTLAVYNSMGEMVGQLLSKDLSAGSHNVSFNAANLPSGTYFYRLNSGDFTATRKMQLIK
ncbi:MAG: T9SS type A sorting domain-containing protein [Ignavibacteria bacterium]|nr:T9SS type A sorting domain-containing protein [Ignavibacteria bacterium]